MIDRLSRHPPQIHMSCPCGYIFLACTHYRPSGWRNGIGVHFYAACGEEETKRRGSWRSWVCPDCGHAPLTDTQIGALEVLYELHLPNDLSRSGDQASRAAVMAHLEGLFLDRGGELEHELYFSFETAEHENRGTGWYVCFYPMTIAKRPYAGYSYTSPWEALADLLACPMNPRLKP